MAEQTKNNGETIVNAEGTDSFMITNFDKWFDNLWSQNLTKEIVRNEREQKRIFEKLPLNNGKLHRRYFKRLKVLSEIKKSLYGQVRENTFSKFL